MFLLLNKDNVIIDIVEDVRYVHVNANGLTVLCHQQDAQGYIGSDNNTIYAKIGTQLIPTYYDIAREQYVDSVADEVEALKYVWDDEKQDVAENPNAYPLDNTALTVQADTNTANIEYLAMMTGNDL